MTAWMNNAVHVEIKIVELFTVRIRLGRIDWNGYAVHLFGMFLHDLGNYLWKLIRKPSIAAIWSRSEYSKRSTIEST